MGISVVLIIHQGSDEYPPQWIELTVNKSRSYILEYYQKDDVANNTVSDPVETSIFRCLFAIQNGTACNATGGIIDNLLISHEMVADVEKAMITIALSETENVKVVSRITPPFDALKKQYPDHALKYYSYIGLLQKNKPLRRIDHVNQVDYVFVI